jgi:hypothetical protein
MNIGDKYVDIDDFENYVIVCNTAEKTARTEAKVMYYFNDNAEQKFTLTRDVFLELYRPYSKLDACLTED